MKYSVIAIILICQLTSSLNLSAQKNFGLLNKFFQKQTIKISEYHQYELKLKKGAINLIRVSDFDVAMEFTVVSPDGIIIEQLNNADTGDYLIFESPYNGKYQLYIKFIDDEKATGVYSIKAERIPSNKNRIIQIEQLIQLLETPERAGTAIAILEKGKLIFEHYHGYSNAENKVNNSSETVFELASVSKQFTGMAIAKLAEQSRLSIEDDIRMYFPELPVYKTPIKIKHLLNHSSGIIDSEYPLALAGFEKDPIDVDRVLNFLTNTPDQYFQTGSTFSYSNDGYTLLGELVKRVTKQSFKDWTKENIFDPLGMKNTIVRDSPELLIPNRAISYKSHMGEHRFHRRNFDFLAPGGCGVRSSMKDLIKWVNYLDQGYHTKESLFQRINKLEMLNNGDSPEYAYGNFITDFRGLKRISHLGLAAGFTTSIARFPDENVSFIFLGNDGDFRNYYVARKMYEIFFSQKLAPISAKFNDCETITFSDTNEKPLLTLNLFDYEGNYFAQQINSTYSFQVIRDTLFAISAAYKHIPLIATGKDTFETDKEFMETIIFQRDFKQSVSDCHIYNDDDDKEISFRKFSSNNKWSKNHRWYSKEHQRKILDSLKQIEASNIFPGFAISVFDESETLFQKGFGYANTKDQKAYAPESIQEIASVTKSITGMAMMKAMEMGYFKLDDAINDYLPFEIINPHFPDHEITIRHLLTHTSSIEDHENYSRGYVFSKSLQKENWPEPHHEGLSLYSDNEKMPLSKFLKELCSPDGIWYSGAEMYTKQRPGTSFEYSNTGFALLGYILELATKVDFKEFTQRHIFDPLEMQSATWELERENPNHVSYYLENYNTCPDYVINTFPDGGLYINIIDLTKFLQEAIKGYAGRGKILSQSSYKEMFRSQSDLFEIEGGLGWDLSIGCCIGHGGNDFGVATIMYFEPNTGLGRIVFTNISIESEGVGNVFYGIMNLLFQ
ncbi:MAG: serine hydrolase domain-containing protein [Bacteroidota bacterium]